MIRPILADGEPAPDIARAQPLDLAAEAHAMAVGVDQERTRPFPAIRHLAGPGEPGPDLERHALHALDRLDRLVDDVAGRQPAVRRIP